MPTTMPTTDRETLIAETVLGLATRAYECDLLDLLHDLTAHTAAPLGLRAVGTTIPDEGPCTGSVRSGTVLHPVTLRSSGPSMGRRPRFTPRAPRAGIVSVASVPLRTGGRGSGAAGTRMRRRRGPLGEDGIAGRSQAAPRHRVVVGQAKGVLSASLEIDVEEVFARLRSQARARREELGDVATRVTRRSTPSGLDATL